MSGKIQQVESTESIEARQADSSEPKKLFIVACQRSGTTMLQHALNRHPEIIIPPETAFFTHFLGHSAKGQAHQLKLINADLGIDLSPPARRLSKRKEIVRWYNKMAAAYLRRLDLKSVTYFGEKTPHHLLRIRRMLRVFPKAKYILVHRDGRDVALSLTKVPWFNNDLYVNFSYWLRCYRHSRWLMAQEAVDLIVVRYEDLVRRPETELRRITDFLGLRYDPRMAEGQGNREGILDWEEDWKGRAAKEITSTRIGNWRRELSADQIAMLERWGARVLTELGYELSAGTQSKHMPLGFFPLLCYKIVVWRTGNAYRVIRKNLFGR